MAGSGASVLRCVGVSHEQNGILALKAGVLGGVFIFKRGELSRQEIVSHRVCGIQNPGVHAPHQLSSRMAQCAPAGLEALVQGPQAQSPSWGPRACVSSQDWPLEDVGDPPEDGVLLVGCTLVK